jgi:sugar fermentation stimulation protein A
MPPAPPQPAQFIDRPNRFLLRCRLGTRIIQAFLPNPGRLWELLLPGVTVYIVKEPPSPTRKNAFTAVAVEREGVPIFLHTHRTNEVAGRLIDQGKVPGWEGARVIGREIRVGHSRFDLLVEHRKKEWLIEVKSCTLFRKRTAMFPDAVTERGARHLRELAELSDRGRRTAVLFIVHWLKAEFFLPAPKKQIPAFGASDCSCPTHLFGMAKDPLGSPAIIRRFFGIPLFTRHTLYLGRK